MVHVCYTCFNVVGVVRMVNVVGVVRMVNVVGVVRMEDLCV